MRCVIALIVLALAVAGTAAAQDLVFVAISTDEAGLECSIMNETSELVFLHLWVVAGTRPRANLVAFNAPTPSCWTATWLGDAFDPAFAWLGSTHAPGGIAISTVGCRDLPVYLGTMNFWAEGTTSPCCSYDILPYATSEDHIVEYIDCGSTDQEEASTRSAVINPDASCPCLEPVSARETTWGKVKALYR